MICIAADTCLDYHVIIIIAIAPIVVAVTAIQRYAEAPFPDAPAVRCDVLSAECVTAVLARNCCIRLPFARGHLHNVSTLCKQELDVK